MLRSFALGVMGVLVLAWCWLAISFHAAGAVALILQGAVLLYGAGFAALLWRRRFGLALAGLVLLGGVGALWYGAQVPHNDRIWAADVQHGVTGQIDGSLVTLRSVRNFRWQDADTAEESWETRVVDADAITSVDMLTSIWSSPLIAHVLVSFGFADGQHIVFSGEIRREQGEVFSALGGLFRKYELVMIAADERDIVHLRTDARGEDVALFPVDLAPEMRKALFLTFINRANELAAEPEWYHTLWANCTTVPYALVRGLALNVGLDWRLLASGKLPSYLYDLGVLRSDLPFDEVLAKAALPPSGANAPEGAAYSAELRAKWN